MSAAATAPRLDDPAVKQELRELVEMGGLDLREDVLDVLVDLTQQDVVPTAITQVLKSLCGRAAKK